MVSPAKVEGVKESDKMDIEGVPQRRKIRRVSKTDNAPNKSP